MIILGSCGTILFRSLIMATRYAVCRRQFSSYSGTKEERKLVDYQTHLNLIGSQLSNVYVLNSVQGFLLALQAESDELLKDENFKMLDVLHHFTSGIKAIGTDVAYKGMDELRQACGGAGFSLASGMVEQWGDFAPSPTYEGVNVVMAQ
jgi:acyl-CoA oxidase